MKRTRTDWEKASDYGIDLSILWHNLQLTPTERIIQHQKAIQTLEEVRLAGAAYYAGLSKNIKTSRRK